MPMDKTVLGPLLKTKIHALSDEDAANPDKVFEAMADAFIEHVSTAAQISGVCTGLAAPSGGGPVTGTAVLPPGSIT